VAGAEDDPTIDASGQWGQRGAYLFKLGSFDTRRLANGAYGLVVVATDTRGNAGSATRRFLVAR
jgi:hypothetical protein